MNTEHKPDEAIEILKASGMDTLTAIRAALAQRDETKAKLSMLTGATREFLADLDEQRAKASPRVRALSWLRSLLPIALLLFATAATLTAQIPRRDTTYAPKAPVELEPHWEVSDGTVRMRYVPKGKAPMRQLPRKKAAEWLRHEPLLPRLN